MKERPIIFNSELIPGLLDGSVTLTQRVMNPQPLDVLQQGMHPIKPNYAVAAILDTYGTPKGWVTCPYGRVGDVLRVKETWATVKSYDHLRPSLIPKGDRRWPAIWYMEPREAAASIPSKRNSGYEFIGRTRNPLFMPKWASRIRLRITDIFAQLVQNTTEAEAQQAGWFFQNHPLDKRYDPASMDTARRWYAELWDRINNKRGYSYGGNPWVWRVTLELVSGVD